MRKPKPSKIRITPAELAALNEAIHVHGITELARRLGTSVFTVQGWRVRGVPPLRVADIERETGVSGKRLKARLYT